MQSIAGIKKVRTFAPAIENDTVAKQERVAKQESSLKDFR